MRAARTDDLGREEPEQRDRAPADRLPLEPDTEILITEMGMRGLGQIADLCAIARPGDRRRPAHRARAPRAPRQRRAGRRGECRGDRGAARREERPSCPPAQLRSSRSSLATTSRSAASTTYAMRRAQGGDALHRRRGDRRARAAVHATSPRPQHARRAARLRRARAVARPCDREGSAASGSRRGVAKRSHSRTAASS